MHTIATNTREERIRQQAEAEMKAAYMERKQRELEEREAAQKREQEEQKEEQKREQEQRASLVEREEERMARVLERLRATAEKAEQVSKEKAGKALDSDAFEKELALKRKKQDVEDKRGHDRKLKAVEAAADAEFDRVDQEIAKAEVFEAGLNVLKATNPNAPTAEQVAAKAKAREIKAHISEQFALADLSIATMDAQREELDQMKELQEFESEVDSWGKVCAKEERGHPGGFTREQRRAMEKLARLKVEMDTQLQLAEFKVQSMENGVESIEQKRQSAIAELQRQRDDEKKAREDKKRDMLSARQAKREQERQKVKADREERDRKWKLAMDAAKSPALVPVPKLAEVVTDKMKMEKATAAVAVAAPAAAPAAASKRQNIPKKKKKKTGPTGKGKVSRDKSNPRLSTQSTSTSTSKPKPKPSMGMERGGSDRNSSKIVLEKGLAIDTMQEARYLESANQYTDKQRQKRGKGGQLARAAGNGNGKSGSNRDLEIGPDVDKDQESRYMRKSVEWAKKKQKSRQKLFEGVEDDGHTNKMAGMNKP